MFDILQNLINNFIHRFQNYTSPFFFSKCVLLVQTYPSRYTHNRKQKLHRITYPLPFKIVVYCKTSLVNDNIKICFEVNNAIRIKCDRKLW